MNRNDPAASPPEVRYEPGRGWICSCTGIYVEQVDFSLDCHHWPLCEHLVAAARQTVGERRRAPPASDEA